MMPEGPMTRATIRDAIERSSRIFTERPAAALRHGLQATARLVDGLRFEVSGPKGVVAHTDMGTPLGGTETAPSPGTLLRAAMAACTATVIAMRAARLDVALETLEVTVESDSDVRGLLGLADVPAAFAAVRTRVRIGSPGIPADRLREIAAWGDAHSPVCCTVRHPPHSTVEVEVVPTGA
jgi:uncharacterized OsmC-like protein